MNGSVTKEMEPPCTHSPPAALVKGGQLLIFQFSFVGLIILLHSVLFISILAYRKLFWPSYHYSLLSSIASSILFTIIAVPVSIIFGNSQRPILYTVMSCKTWSVVSHVLWDASIFSLIYLNIDLIVSLMWPHIYRLKAYQSIIKLTLILFWLCSFIVNILLVAAMPLKTGHLNPIQPCLHIAGPKYFLESSTYGLILIILAFALAFILASNVPPPQIGQKLTCCIFPLLLLDGFIIGLRVIPEILHLILILKSNLLVNPFDEKYLLGQLDFISWSSLFLLPVFWILDPNTRQIVIMTFTCPFRSCARENAHSSSPEDENLH